MCSALQLNAAFKAYTFHTFFYMWQDPGTGAVAPFLQFPHFGVTDMRCTDRLALKDKGK